MTFPLLVSAPENHQSSTDGKQKTSSGGHHFDLVHLPVSAEDSHELGHLNVSLCSLLLLQDRRAEQTWKELEGGGEDRHTRLYVNT